MGKWTPNHYDNVLNHKIKALVQGAVKRLKLEKVEPTISYETFVEDLDIGDSFTASLVDILVKELAERRTRSNPADRRLIADRSAKSLRLLATPLRVYRDRSLGAHSATTTGSHINILPSRRYVNLTEEMEMDEDLDEFENFLGGGSLVEGTRMNTELFDAYGTNAPVWQPYASSLRRASTLTSLVDPLGPSSGPGISNGPGVIVVSPPASPPPPNVHGPWTLPPHAAYGNSRLTRQLSIRRPPRSSRTIDFNDFTTSRRSAVRAQELEGSRSDEQTGSGSNAVASSSSSSLLPRVSSTTAGEGSSTRLPRRNRRLRASIQPQAYTGREETVLADIVRASLSSPYLSSAIVGNWTTNSPTDAETTFGTSTNALPPPHRLDVEEDLDTTEPELSGYLTYPSILGTAQDVLDDSPTEASFGRDLEDSMQRQQQSQSSERQVEDLLATASYPTPGSLNSQLEESGP